MTRENRDRAEIHVFPNENDRSGPSRRHQSLYDPELQNRIARLDPLGHHLMQHYSGNTFESMRATLKIIEKYQNENADRWPIVRIHEPEQPKSKQTRHECQIPGCARIFPTLQKATVHLFSHHWGLKNWSCLQNPCDRQYRSRSDLTRHLKVDHSIIEDDITNAVNPTPQSTHQLVQLAPSNASGVRRKRPAPYPKRTITKHSQTSPGTTGDHWGHRTAMSRDYGQAGGASSKSEAYFNTLGQSAFTQPGHSLDWPARNYTSSSTGMGDTYLSTTLDSSRGLGEHDAQERFDTVQGAVYGAVASQAFFLPYSTHMHYSGVATAPIQDPFNQHNNFFPLYQPCYPCGQTALAHTVPSDQQVARDNHSSLQDRRVVVRKC